MKQTVIAEGTEIRGSISSTCPVVVLGKVDGDVSAPSVEIAGAGTVTGTIRVDALAVDGALAGGLVLEVGEPPVSAAPR